MSYTYDPSQISLRDKARFYVGDTDIAKPLLNDEEFDATLGAFEYNVALATILESLANKFSSLPDEYDESGRVKLSWKNRGSAWMANAKMLRGADNAGAGLTSPQVNGIAMGAIVTDSAGYRPHNNGGALPWRPWGG